MLNSPNTFSNSFSIRFTNFFNIRYMKFFTNVFVFVHTAIERSIKISQLINLAPVKLDSDQTDFAED